MKPMIAKGIIAAIGLLMLAGPALADGSTIVEGIGDQWQSLDPQYSSASKDAQILGDVYIALTSGQEEIGFGSADDVRPGTAHAQAFDTSRLLPRPRVVATASEREAHEARLAKLRKKAGHAIWDGPKVEESAA